MALLGPELGDAYVEVHADTRRLPQEIRRGAKKAGQEFGKEFGKGANSSLDQELSVVARRYRRAMTKAGELGGEDFGAAVRKSVKDKFRNFDDDLREAVASGNWSHLFDSFDTTPLDDVIDKIKLRLTELQETSKQSFKNSFSEAALRDAINGMSAYADVIRKAKIASEEHARAEADRKNKVAALNSELYDQVKASEDLRRSEDKLIALAHEMNKAFDDQRVKEHAASMDSWRLALDRLRESEEEHVTLLQRQVDADHDEAIRMNNRVSGFRRLTRGLRDFNGQYSLLGRMAGSRNNFLNLVGIAAQGVEQGFARLIDKMAEIPEKFRAFAESVATNGGGIQGFSQSLSQAFSGDWVSALVKIGLAVTTVTSGIGLTISAIGLLVAAASGLLAILTALAGAIVGGLIAGLLTLGPLLVAVTFGAGALATAFIGMDDAAKDLTKNTLKPMVDFFKALGDEVRKNVLGAIADNMGAIKEILNNFIGPLLLTAAQALSNVIDYFVQAFQRPEVQATLEELKSTLPGILTQLGQAFTDLLTGALGFFTTIAPFAQDFANRLSTMLTNFSNFANSPEGQTKIQTFFDTLYDAFLAMLDLVDSLMESLGLLFEQVTPTGQTFLEKIIAIVDKFNEWANSEEGRATIAEWMQFAKDLASSLWQAIQEVGKWIDQLDSPQNRQSVIAMVDAFSEFMRLVQLLTDLFAPMQKVGTLAFKGIEAAASVAQRVIEGLVSWIGKAIQAAKNLDVGGVLSKAFNLHLPQFANGSIVAGPTHAVIGEAGPEAVVPLARPLSQVDPSVRWLSAIAQGKNPAMGNGGVTGGGINVQQGAIQVVTPATDGRQIASAVLDRLVAAAK